MLTSTQLGRGLAVGMFAVLCAALPASADFSAISSPDAAYLAATTKIDLVGSDYTNVTSITDGTLTIDFGSTVQLRTVPASWATWDVPPNTESDEPRIVWTGGDTSETLTFSAPLKMFGFEAEPNPFAVHSMTLTFYNGASIVGSIIQNVSGAAGARLFAGATTTEQFTKVVVSSTADFAMGQFRYATGSQVVPAPGAALLVLVGTGLVNWARRRVS